MSAVSQNEAIKESARVTVVGFSNDEFLTISGDLLVGLLNSGEEVLSSFSSVIPISCLSHMFRKRL